NIIDGGTVQISVDTQLGAVPGAVTANSIQLNSGASLAFSANTTLSTNRGITLGAGGGVLGLTAASTSLTYAGVITGSGNLVLAGSTGSGPNNFTLSGTQTYTGTTFINQARLIVATATNF